MDDIQVIERTINVDDLKHSDKTKDKIAILQDFLSIVHDDEIDGFFLLILDKAADLGYNFKDTPKALLEKING